MTKTTFADPADDEPEPYSHGDGYYVGFTGNAEVPGYTRWVVQSVHINQAESAPMTTTISPDHPSVNKQPDLLVGPGHAGVPEFPDGGDPRFRKLLSEMLTVHVKKGADYGTDGDFLANCRGSENLGIDAWKGVLIRMGDKMIRLHNAARGKKLQNESVQDSFMDLANYSIIALILFNEEVAKEEAAAAEAARRDRIERGSASASNTAHPSFKHMRVSMLSDTCTCGAKLEHGLCPNTF